MQTMNDELTPTDNDSTTDVETEQDEEIQDDAIIGHALRLSLIVFVGSALLVCVAVWWVRQDDEPELIDGPVSSPVAVRTQTELEIPRMHFTDITNQAGLDFVHENGAVGEKLLPETMGSGCAFFDFDADGDQDILLTNGAEWPWNTEGSDRQPTQKLYRNDGSGRFEDVTAGSGLDVPLYATGLACGDYDNDGRVDVYIGSVGRNRLFHNDGNGRFRDVTASAGVAGNEEWSTSCGFFDVDGDGDLDLFVCNYVVWSREYDLAQGFTLLGKDRAYGRPQDFRGTYPVLYRNDGDGTFADISSVAGVQIHNPDTGEPMAKSLGLTFADVNDDGRLDPLVANDTVPNMLFLNQPNGTFVEQAATTGIAFDIQGNARGAMGICVARFRNASVLGVAIGNFANEMTAMYVSSAGDPGSLNFTDEAVANGIGPVTRTELTFGILFVDFDLDGRPDLFAANGHLEDDIHKVQESQHYEQPPRMLWNCGPDRDDEFVAAGSDHCGEDFSRAMVGRAATCADIDGDGDRDLLICASGRRPRLLRNDQDTGHHWLRFKLLGTRCNRDAIGASVTVETADGRSQILSVMPTCSYQSQTELPLTFGLGTQTRVSAVRIDWPDGQTQVLKDVAIDRMMTIEQP